MYKYLEIMIRTLLGRVFFDSVNYALNAAYWHARFPESSITFTASKELDMMVDTDTHGPH